MKESNVELAVGFFLLVGIIALAYISVKLGKLEVLGKPGYTVFAEFDNDGGIKTGASVEIAGVPIGKVNTIRLADYQAVVELDIYRNVKLQEDSIASIKTKGLIGEKYIQITPGGSEKLIANRGKIRETESAVDIESLISKYVFGKV
jgi:phospholipid/cholesterol/gamma-HCH transport system substrate-binding protein